MRLITLLKIPQNVAEHTNDNSSMLDHCSTLPRSFGHRLSHWRYLNSGEPGSFCCCCFGWHGSLLLHMGLLKLQCAGFSLCWLLLLQTMVSRAWNPPRPGIEPVSPTLAGGLPITGPTRKSQDPIFVRQGLSWLLTDWLGLGWMGQEWRQRDQGESCSRSPSERSWGPHEGRGQGEEDRF